MTKTIQTARSKKGTERVFEQLKLVKTDPLTGDDTVTHHVIKSRLPAEPPFVKLYIDDLSKLLDVTEAPKRLLLLLVERLDYDGFISITPAARKRMCERLGIKPQTFANYLQNLVKSDLLRSAGRGEYCVNPLYFAKGDWSQIVQLRDAYKSGLELRISYEPDGRKVVRAVQRSVSPQLPLFEELCENSVVPFEAQTETFSRVHESPEALKEHLREAPEENPRRAFSKAK